MADSDHDLDRLFRQTADLEPSTGFADRVMARASAGIAPEERLDQLMRATAGLAPTADFTVELPPNLAVAEQTSDASFEELFAATASLSPSEALTDAIMVRVAAVAPIAKLGFIETLTRSSRAALFAAGAIAAASVGISVYTQASLDADVMASVDTMEPGD